MLIVLLLCVFSSVLHAEIFEIDRIDEMRAYAAGQNVLCLFDSDESLNDAPFDLGSPPWRNGAGRRSPPC